MHQCEMHKNLWCVVCTCILVRLCACEPVSLADSSGRLEIKTLCGTWLVIRWELKQKAEESTGEKKESRGEQNKMGSAGEKRESAFAAVLQLVSGLLFIRIPDRPFPVGSPLSVVGLNVNEIGKIDGGEETCE